MPAKKLDAMQTAALREIERTYFEHVAARAVEEARYDAALTALNAEYLPQRAKLIRAAYDLGVPKASIARAVGNPNFYVMKTIFEKAGVY